MKYNYSIVVHDDKRNCLVKTCSECCKTEIDGKFNIRGMLHRQQYRAKWGGLDCSNCPVHLKSRETGEFDEICRLMDGEK